MHEGNQLIVTHILLALLYIHVLLLKDDQRD